MDNKLEKTLDTVELIKSRQKQATEQLLAFKKRHGLTFIELQDFVDLTEKTIQRKIRGVNKWKAHEVYFITNFLINI